MITTIIRCSPMCLTSPNLTESIEMISNINATTHYHAKTVKEISNIGQLNEKYHTIGVVTTTKTPTKNKLRKMFYNPQTNKIKNKKIKPNFYRKMSLFNNINRSFVN